jgi:hypothetical protein
LGVNWSHQALGLPNNCCWQIFSPICCSPSLWFLNSFRQRSPFSFES